MLNSNACLPFQHALTIVHTKKLLGKATVAVYVDGCEIHNAQLQYPTLNKVSAPKLKGLKFFQ